MEVKVARFELYPIEEPTGYAVGFHIALDNGRSFYADALVPLTDADGKSDEEIVEIAWNTLKDSINARVEELSAKSPIVGSTWTPPE